MMHADESMDLSYQIYKVALEKYNQTLPSLSDAEQEEVYRVAQRKLKIEQVVLSSAEAANVVVPERQVDEAFANIVDGFGDEQDFTRDLAQLGLDATEFKKLLARELRVEFVMDYVALGCDPVSEEDISLFYHMNAAKFQQPEIRTARHILVTINESNPENSRQAARSKISQIKDRINRKPDRFEEQALKHSECPTSLEGGLLGQVKAGVLYPELETVAFQLQLGELSEVVESPLGFHLLRIDEIESAGLVPLERVKDKLSDFLADRNRKRAQRDWLGGLLSNQSDLAAQDGELSNA